MLNFKMLANFMDSFMATHGNLPVVSDGVLGLGLRAVQCGVPGPAALWVVGRSSGGCRVRGAGPGLHTARSCSPAVLCVTVLLWSLSWGSSEPLISDLSGHFCSLHEVRVNVGIKKGGSRGCAEAKNGTEFRERFHGCKQYFLIPEELTAVGRGPSSKGGNDGSTADPRGGLGQNLWLCADGKAPWMLLREGRRNF